MAKLEAVIKESIARGARRQIRAAVMPLRREIVRLRLRVAQLQGTLTTLQRTAAGWKRIMEAAPLVPPVSEEEATSARLSPLSILPSPIVFLSVSRLCAAPFV